MNIYVSMNRGTNAGDGSQANPMKFLWKAAKMGTDNATFHIAGGRYPCQGKTGVLDKFTGRNIRILGGYNDDFTERNPFKYLTIIGAPEGQDTNTSTNTVIHIEPADPRGNVEIVVDGITIDRGECAYYCSDGEPGANKRVEGHKDSTCFGYRDMNTKLSGSNPTITVISREGNVVIRNCLLINNPWWGIYVKGGGNGEIRIENNLILSYQGRGIESITGGGWGNPHHILRNNSILFGRYMEGRAVSADPRVGAGSYTLDSNVIAFSDQGGVVVKFKDPNPLVMKNNLMFCNIAGDYNIAAVGVCNADELEDNVMFPCDGNIHECPLIISKMHQHWFDRYSQSETPGFLTRFVKEPEVMKMRTVAGLGEYHLAGYGQAYATYGSLPEKRPNYKLSRYPHPMKIGQLINFEESVLPMLGADGPRGVQATPFI